MEGLTEKDGFKEVRYYQKEKGYLQCQVCPHCCKLKEGQRGICRVRKNIKGKIYATNYGRCSSYGLDPIEKKPLRRFYPGSNIFSIGTVGCNLSCGFCQNWQIAQGEPVTVALGIEELVTLAGENNSIGVAYTYSEPMMWYEFVYDAARAIRQTGLKNILVTNGYINPEPLEDLLPFIDAMNIDVKAFTGDYYNRLCGGRLEPVLKTVERAAASCHVEITTLLVTGLNDSPEEIGKLVDWLAALDPNIPLHLSRYFPNYKLDLEPTPLDTMYRAREIALEKLKYVYLGNI